MLGRARVPSSCGDVIEIRDDCTPCPCVASGDTPLQHSFLWPFPGVAGGERGDMLPLIPRPVMGVFMVNNEGIPHGDHDAREMRTSRYSVICHFCCLHYLVIGEPKDWETLAVQGCLSPPSLAVQGCLSPSLTSSLVVACTACTSGIIRLTGV